MRDLQRGRLGVKIRGNGQAKVLNPAEITLIFKELRTVPRDACLFAICFFTGCRISEALQLRTEDIFDNAIVFRKGNTKGKLKTRTVPINAALRKFLADYQPPKPGAMFPGQLGRNEFLSRNTADVILKQACKRVGIMGVSTHSFRRTALTHMSRQGIPLRTIQEISGHSSLSTLQRYLEVSPEEMQKAIDSLTL